MEARLVYTVGRSNVTLMEGPLEEIDKKIYDNYETTDDIICKNASVIGDMDIDGDFSILFNTKDIPFQCVEVLSLLGFDVNNYVQKIPVLVGEKNVEPTAKGLFSDFLNKLVRSPKITEDFYDKFNDYFSKEEKLSYAFSMFTDTMDYNKSGISRVVKDMAHSDNAYIFGRALQSRYNNCIIKDENKTM